MEKNTKKYNKVNILRFKTSQHYTNFIRLLKILLQIYPDLVFKILLVLNIDVYTYSCNKNILITLEQYENS